MSIKKEYKNIFVVIFPIMMVLLLFVALIGTQQNKEYRSKAYVGSATSCTKCNGPHCEWHDSPLCTNDGCVNDSECQSHSGPRPCKVCTTDHQCTHSNAVVGSDCEGGCGRDEDCGGGPTPNPKTDACLTCASKNNCVGTRWCGNDCQYHSENNNDIAYGCKNADDTPTTPTPIPANRKNECGSPPRCVGTIWCGNDGKLNDPAGLTEGCRDTKGNPTTPTPIPPKTPTTNLGANPNACAPQSTCIDGRWCGNTNAWEEKDNNDIAHGCQTADGTKTTPTPIPADRENKCSPSSHCVGVIWCGNDGKLNDAAGLTEGCRDTNGNQTTPTPMPTAIAGLPRTQSANATSWEQVQTLAVEGKVNAAQVSAWVNEAAQYYYPGIKTKFCDPMKGECDFKL